MCVLGEGVLALPDGVVSRCLLGVTKGWRCWKGGQGRVCERGGGVLALPDRVVSQ